MKFCPGPSQRASRMAYIHDVVQTVPGRRRGDSQRRADHPVRVRHWRSPVDRARSTEADQQGMTRASVSERPVIPPLALGPRPARQPLPAAGGNPRGDLVCANRPAGPGEAPGPDVRGFVEPGETRRPVGPPIRSGAPRRNWAPRFSFTPGTWPARSGCQNIGSPGSSACQPRPLSPSAR